MGKQVNVVFLDDEENILKSITRLFIKAPYGVFTTSDPNEAMACLAREKDVKVILSDHRMPKITGIEFLRQVEKNYPDVIRILFTGYADVESQDIIKSGQIYQKVNKPWNSGELKTIVQQAIEHYDHLKEDRED